MLGNLIAGITSGIFVTLFVVVFRALWNHRIVPWFEERVYKDAKIEGEWFSLYPTWQDKRQELIVLERRGHAVTGTVTCTKGNDAGEQYDVRGSFRNMILPLMYEAHDRNKTDRGAITLKLTRNAAQFDGKIACYGDRSDSITSTDVSWFRSKKDLEVYLAELQTREKKNLEDYLKRMREAEEARQRLRKKTGEAVKEHGGELKPLVEITPDRKIKDVKRRPETKPDTEAKDDEEHRG